jgi:capsular exopolysaccharide synthesis family protein
MDPLVHTASKPQVLSDARPAAARSTPWTPWAQEEEANANTIGNRTNGAKSLRIEDLGDAPFVPLRRLDNSWISNEVLMAQRLSQQETKNLHFILQRYRLLCNRFVEAARNLNSKVFLITSALAEEGKTLTTANLAFALSGIENKRTLLIDLDLRRYSLQSLLGVSSVCGEKSFLKVKDWHDSLWSLRPNLHALLTTQPVDQPDELLQSIAIEKLLTAARREYDYILIDSAPLLLTADTHALLPIIDQALLVVRADATPIACSQDALKILGEKAVGCILNDVKRMKYEAYYNSYYGT